MGGGDTHRLSTPRSGALDSTATVAINTVLASIPTRRGEMAEVLRTSSNGGRPLCILYIIDIYELIIIICVLYI